MRNEINIYELHAWYERAWYFVVSINLLTNTAVIKKLGETEFEVDIDDCRFAEGRQNTWSFGK